MSVIEIPVSTPYTVTIGDGIAAAGHWRTIAQAHAERWIVVTDAAVYRNFHELLVLFNSEIIQLPSGEQHKTRETKAFLEDRLQEMGAGRDVGLIALGGGMITDLVGFTAATFCRGVPVIYLPTTLMAMVDASIGGKTGVNTSRGKNLIGTITHPIAIFSDVVFLRDAPAHAYHDGVFEVIKHALIADATFFSELSIQCSLFMVRDISFLMALITRSVQIKSSIVGQDPFEKGARALLNYGHTVAHALEFSSHYKISHGQAVAIGLCIESYLSMVMGTGLSLACVQAIVVLLKKYGMQPQLIETMCPKEVQAAFFSDKKCHGGIVYSVFLASIGVPFMTAEGKYTAPMPMDRFLEAWIWMQTQ